MSMKNYSVTGIDNKGNAIEDTAYVIISEDEARCSAKKMLIENPLIKNCIIRTFQTVSIDSAELQKKDKVKLSDIQELINDRGKDHGSYERVATITQLYISIFERRTDWINRSAIVRTSIWMICYKLARLAIGNILHLDSWRDIIGYATLALNHLEGRKPEECE